MFRRIIAIEELNKELEKKSEMYRAVFDERIRDYFFNIDYEYFNKLGYIADNGWLYAVEIDQEKKELDKLITENTNECKLRMNSYVNYKYAHHPSYEIIVR